MNAALVSMVVPFFAAMLVLMWRPRQQSWLVIVASIVSLLAAVMALLSVVDSGPQSLNLGGWESPLAIRFQLMPVNALLIVTTAVIHLIVVCFAASSHHCQPIKQAFWPLALLLHGSLVALWLSMDLFNWYVTLELLGLSAVALVTLAGHKALRAALDYLLLSLFASLTYLLGVVILYGQYGTLDIALLATLTEADRVTQTALLLISAGLMLKAALWPLHLWLPAAHSSAPTPVSALLSALVVKAPLFILWLLWSRVAPSELAVPMGFWLALLGGGALLIGGWSACRTPHLKTLVAYSTVAQLGYGLLALGLLLHWQLNDLQAALWLFVVAHALAKTSMFLAAGEIQAATGKKRLNSLRGMTLTMPVALFAFAVAGGSLIGLPPSGGFIAKWLLIQPMLIEPAYWPWALLVIIATLLSAAYVFRVVSQGFRQSSVSATACEHGKSAQWLALLPAILVWLMALFSEPLLQLMDVFSA